MKKTISQWSFTREAARDCVALTSRLPEETGLSVASPVCDWTRTANRSR